MKIMCSGCKKIIGEKAPFKDSSEIKAKCNDCIAKEKAVIPRFEPSIAPKDGQEVTLDCGLKGTLWIAKTDDEKLSFVELGLSGKKFFCAQKYREQFLKYLESIKDEQYDVSFLHSITYKLNPYQKGHKKKEDRPTEEEKKNESFQYNCTVKADRQFALAMFDWMAKRLDNVVEILSQASQRVVNNMCPHDNS